MSVRKPAGGVIFSPDTLPGYRYGFLVQYCRISADNGYVTAPTGHFGRAWDQGASSTGYLPGVSPNGQLVIRNSELGPGFDVLACGPEPMLEAIAALCPAAQLAWEAPMACGYGACYGCVVEIDGAFRRLCLEGPVLDAARVRARVEAVA